MKRCILFIILNLLAVHFGYTQQILTSRIVDFSVFRTGVPSNDQGNQIIIVDSNTFLCGIGAGKFSYFINATVYFKPAFLITDSLFNPRDTVYFSDTVEQTIITYDRKHNNVWMVSYLANQARFRFRRVNLQGQVLYQDLFPNNDSDFKIIADVYNAYPDEEGGLYLLGRRSVALNGVQRTISSLSRFDSTGILLWQRDYDVYRGGPCDYMEKLPNGNLFIFGKYESYNVGYLEVNPENGDLISNRLLYTFRVGSSVIGNGPYVSRTVNGGYFVSGSAGGSLPSSLTDSAAFMASLDSNANIIWRKSSRYGTYMSMSCTDTTVWIMRFDSIQSYSFEHYRLDTFKLLHKLIIRRGGYSAGNSRVLNDLATLRNGSVYMIGALDTPPYPLGALFFNKITNVGVAYNPFYQPYPPLPQRIDTLSTQALSNEPALQLYPNPGNSTLHISHTGELHLYNMQGQLVVQKLVQAGDVINTASLPSGCYIARFRTRTAWLQSKWVKE